MSASRRMVVPAFGIWVVPFLVLGMATTAQGQVATETGLQVLTRGPIHEAFAEASMTGATAGVVIARTPYDPISELPPDQRPEGNNVAWIPGYWSWDNDRSDFIWLSGVWRDLPPGRQWVPGYWARVQGGSQWISGFWGDVAQNEVDYLPAPPKSLEAGPSSPRPRHDNIWTSGSWVWQQTRYDWQPGYWVEQQPDWVWTPAHYTWTPRGYVYVQGYWDNDMVHRGVMFAPVYYEQPVYKRSSYSYSPSTIIDLLAIAASLFVQPRSNQYYYGDYYDARYEQRGIYPWHSEQVRRYGDDPMYVHYRSTQLQQDPDWDAHMDEQYRYRRDHVDARPPQTLALQVNFINTQRAGVPENLIIGRSLADAVQSKSQPVRFTPLNIDERRQIEARGREVHKLQFERARIETLPAAAGKLRGARETAQPVRVQLPVSPVASRPVENVEGARTPPPMPVAPTPQAVEGRGRQVKSQKVKANTEMPTSQKKPGKAKRNVPAHPERTEARPTPTNEKSQRVEPKPATTRLESTPQTPAPKAEPSKRERVPTKTTVRTRSRSRTPQVVETRRPQEEAASPEAKSHKPPQDQSKSRTVEAKRELSKPEAPKSEVRSQELESPKAEPSQSDTKKRQGKREQAPSSEDNKNKKSNER